MSSTETMTAEQAEIAALRAQLAAAEAARAPLYYDAEGWLSDIPIEGRSTSVPLPTDTALSEGQAWNWTGREWVALARDQHAGAGTPEPPAPPRMIAVGAFFDRFGANKWGILSSADALVQALVRDCSVRVKSGINLDAPDVRQGVLLLVSKGFAMNPDALLGAPVRESERP